VYFWFGTGGHYALEDYHGYNYYKHPSEAFKAYIQAQKAFAANNPRYKIPLDVDEQATLGESMMDYYLIWLKTRSPYETLWVNGVPQVEVKCEMLLPYTNEHYDEVRYQFTIDRIVVIEGELWVLDYKFFARDWSSNLDFDAQMEAYIWAASTIYEKPIRGAIMQKHFKKVPEEPKILSSGRLSSDKNQPTTYQMYRQALEEMYISVELAPLANRNCMQELMLSEGEERDDFIQRDRTERTIHQQEATGEQVMMELPEMLNPDLPLYKNATKDCSYDCNFSDICIMMDSGVDWESALYESTVDRLEEPTESWRTYLPHNQLSLQS
jgi:hypothetical protein